MNEMYQSLADLDVRLKELEIRLYERIEAQSRIIAHLRGEVEVLKARDWMG